MELRRVNIKLAQKDNDRLEALKSATDKTATEVIKEALFYYEKLISLKSQNRILLEYGGRYASIFEVSVDLSSSGLARYQQTPKTPSLEISKEQEDQLRYAAKKRD